MVISKITPKRIFKILKLRWLKNFGGAKSLADYTYFLTFGKRINWENPEDLNQWINWLSFNTDTTVWSRLADKYSVRDYVSSKGFEELLVPILNAWDSPGDFSLKGLPERFVLKINNGSGDVRIITNKESVDEDEIKGSFKVMFDHPFGLSSAEPHYTRIKPKLIAEELLDNTKQNGVSNSLIDYKFWCFNGKPYVCFVVSNRTKETFVIDAYKADEKWECCTDEFLVFNKHHLRGQGNIPRPKSLSKMLRVASVLSAGFPQVRVDFYEIDGKPYFGEMTFTSMAGRMDYFSQKALDTMGNLCKYAVKELGIS